MEADPSRPDSHEQAVIASGLEWVSLRPNEYASNFLGLWAAQLRSGNVIRAEQARQAMLAQGFPEGFVTGYLLLQAEAVHRPAPVTHTVEEILGRPATDFATWAADHAESFRGMAA